jgi:hypothetical protein
MTIDCFEADLRAALAQHAATVPAEATARVCRLDYRPRTRSHVATTGLAALAVAVAGAYAGAEGGFSGLAGPQHRSPATAAGQTLRLADFSFTLPTGAQVVTGAAASDGSCAPSPPPTPGVPETVTRAGGEFTVVNGGCLNVDLAPPDVPGDARPVVVGTWNGFVLSDPAADSVTLYIDSSTNQDLVFTATGTGMSPSQLVAMAAAGLTPCSPKGENAPSCATAP